MRNDTVQAIKDFQIKTFGNRKKIEKAENLLNSNEKVLFITPTSCNITDSISRKKDKLPGIAILTDKRFIFHYSIFTDTSTDSILIDEIHSVKCHGNGLSGGHVEIHTISKIYDILVSYKKDIMQKIQNTFEQSKISTKSANEEIQSSDVFTQIEKLASLKEKGIITENEFQIKKEELLKKV